MLLVTKKITLGNQTQTPIVVACLVIKKILDSPLLLEISNSFEEAVLTEMYFITLTIVPSAITPARLEAPVLETAIL